MTWQEGVLRFALAIVSAAVIAACSSRDLRPASRHHRVEISGFTYRPATMRVAPGDTITWTNRDIVAHTATAADGEWDTGTIAAGDSATLVWTGGTGEYLCTFHPTMRALLEPVEGPAAAVGARTAK